jgi:hypothetical protein
MFLSCLALVPHTTYILAMRYGNIHLFFFPVFVSRLTFSLVANGVLIIIFVEWWFELPSRFRQRRTCSVTANAMTHSAAAAAAAAGSAYVTNNRQYYGIWYELQLNIACYFWLSVYRFFRPHVVNHAAERLWLPSVRLTVGNSNTSVYDINKITVFGIITRDTIVMLHRFWTVEWEIWQQVTLWRLLQIFVPLWCNEIQKSMLYKYPDIYL